MKTGTTHTGTVTHFARLDPVATKRTGVELFVPACSAANRRTLTYLNIDNEEKLVGCKRCQVWAKKIAESKAKSAARLAKMSGDEMLTTKDEE